MDDFILKSPELCNLFYSEQTELNDTFLYEAQQQDPVLRQLLLWKRYKKHPCFPSLAICANKGLLHYCQRFQDLSINETNNLLYYIQETTSQNLSAIFSSFSNISCCAFSRSFRSSWS